MWTVDLTYGEAVLFLLYLPALFFLISLWGKARLTKTLFIASTVTMGFAFIAQIIGLDLVWRLPEQEWILKEWILFPPEEGGYWHASLLLCMFIKKHLEVYHGFLVDSLHIRFCIIIGRCIRLRSYTIQTNRQLIAIFLTSIFFASYMFIVENYSIIQRYFEYYNNQITFYVILVPFEGLMMYYLVSYFYFFIKSIVERILKWVS